MQYACTISAHLPALCIKQKWVQLNDCGPVCSIINADIFFVFHQHLLIMLELILWRSILQAEIISTKTNGDCARQLLSYSFKSNITIDISLQSSKKYSLSFGQRTDQYEIFMTTCLTSRTIKTRECRIKLCIKAALQEKKNQSATTSTPHLFYVNAHCIIFM